MGRKIYRSMNTEAKIEEFEQLLDELVRAEMDFEDAKFNIEDYADELKRLTTRDPLQLEGEQPTNDCESDIADLFDARETFVDTLKELVALGKAIKNSDRKAWKSRILDELGKNEVSLFKEYILHELNGKKRK